MKYYIGETYNMRAGGTATITAVSIGDGAELVGTITEEDGSVVKNETWNLNGRYLKERGSSFDLVSRVEVEPRFKSTHQPRKHAEVIKAWADGAEIEYSRNGEAWYPTIYPKWDATCQYRIKPTRKLNIVSWSAIYDDGSIGLSYPSPNVGGISVLRIELDMNGVVPVLVSAKIEEVLITQ